MKSYHFCLIGFGNVGQAFARLLLKKQSLLEKTEYIQFKVTGIATGRHGKAINPDGLDLEKALSLMETHQSLSSLSSVDTPDTMLEFIKACPADVLFENSPVNHQNGQPAINYLITALNQGMHCVTANKGTVVHGYRQLADLAAKHEKRFMFESTVMDGAPIFSLFRGALPCTELKSFEGILNSTSNLILERMEKGDSFEQAVVYTQSAGLAETDPSTDIDGWDAAIKVAALSTVLMGVPLKPQEVNRLGIRAITKEMIDQAAASGERWKLVCRAKRQGDQVFGSVAPELVSPSSALYTINGSSSYCQFELDTLPGLGITEMNPSPETTAFGLLADFINISRGM